MAVAWCRKAAEQGIGRAQNNLGVMYRSSHGVPQDYATAVSLFQKAAQQGDAEAQNNLGVMYEHGHGVPQDYVQAHMWFNLAASSLKPPEVDLAAKNRTAIAAMMTPAQIAEAQKLARE